MRRDNVTAAHYATTLHAMLPAMKFLALATLAVAAYVAPARADVHPNAEAGVSVDIPKSWKIGGQGAVMFASDPKEEAGLIFMVTDAGDMKKSGDQLDAQLAKTMKDVKWSAQSQVTLNGMKGVAMKGTATINKKAANLGAVILMTPKNKGLFVVGALQSDKEAAHKKELDGIIESIKPIK